MTVFAIFSTEKQPSWAAISDAAITTNEIENHPSDTIPARFGLPNSEFGGRTRNLLSKCVVREECCIHWAGPVVEARQIIRKLLDIRPRSIDEFNKLMWQFDEYQQKTLNICFSFFDDDEFPCSFMWNCSHRTYPNFDLVCGGSGTQDVIESIDHSASTVPSGQFKFVGADPGLPVTGEDALIRAMTLVASLLDIDRFDQSRGILDFGGAYELVVCDKSGFRRVPFSVAETYMGYSNKMLGYPRDRVMNVAPLENGFAVLVGADFEETKNENGFKIEKCFLIPEIVADAAPLFEKNKLNIETEIDILRVVSQNVVDRDTYVGYGLVYFVCSNSSGAFQARTGIRFNKLASIISKSKNRIG